MHVFTAIYLAEKLESDIEGVEESQRLDDPQPWPVEHTLRQRIAMLENRNWFEDDEADR